MVKCMVKCMGKCMGQMHGANAWGHKCMEMHGVTSQWKCMGSHLNIQHLLLDQCGFALQIAAPAHPGFKTA